VETVLYNKKQRLVPVSQSNLRVFPATMFRYHLILKGNEKSPQQSNSKNGKKKKEKKLKKEKKEKKEKKITPSTQPIIEHKDDRQQHESNMDIKKEEEEVYLNINSFTISKTIKLSISFDYCHCSICGKSQKLFIYDTSFLIKRYVNTNNNNNNNNKNKKKNNNNNNNNNNL
jgi:hypothetical protein